jgi:hypothetical protein
MGLYHSKDVNQIEFDKKLHIVIDIYLKPSCNGRIINIDNLQTNDFLKRTLKEIIMKGFTSAKCNVSILDNNVLLISKKDKTNISYLELNIIATFNEISSNILSNLTIPKIRLNIFSEFYKYTSNSYEIVVERDMDVIILYNTLYAINIYQNK